MWLVTLEFMVLESLGIYEMWEETAANRDLSTNLKCTGSIQLGEFYLFKQY